MKLLALLLVAVLAAVCAEEREALAAGTFTDLSHVELKAFGRSVCPCLHCACLLRVPLLCRESSVQCICSAESSLCL
eukprot:m.388028 g.388028  ORF g.388028 m.388028 type:complete len:77 (-) comp56316_c0_seq13:2453-2683(-)